jgi:hypothetical protein
MMNYISTPAFLHGINHSGKTFSWGHGESKLIPSHEQVRGNIRHPDYISGVGYLHSAVLRQHKFHMKKQSEIFNFL